MGKVWDVLAPRNLELGPLAGHERAGSPWRNWLLARDDDGIAWLALDKANASANTLSEDVLAELNDVLASLERDMPKGLVLRSAKPKGFIAGADIGEFRGIAWRRRRSRSCTAIASAAGSRSRSPATIASPSRTHRSDFPRSCSACIRASAARCACRG